MLQMRFVMQKQFCLFNSIADIIETKVDFLKKCKVHFLYDIEEPWFI